MTFDKIELQKFAVQILKTHIERERLASTYLIMGSRGSGKEEIAFAFASSLLCSGKKIFESCECITCSRIMSYNHPDVRLLGGDEKARSIKIEEVRGMLNWAYLKPFEGLRKVCIVNAAERLTIEASNAILKTLEEPPDQTVFCLLVENKEHLLETIQSRSFHIRLRPLEDIEAEECTAFQESFDSSGGGDWEEFLENYQSKSRDQLKSMMRGLMLLFQKQMRESSAETYDDANSILAAIKAIEVVYNTMEANESNANQKLALTRLAMQLRKIMPRQGMLR